MENEMSGLPIDNLENLKESVKMSGFENYFDGQIEENVRAGKKEFSLDKSSHVEGDKMEYTLDFRVDHENRKGYLNDLHATLKEADGPERSQRFPRFLRITAKEAYNLLKWGIDTGVEKHLFNKKDERYRSFVTLDLKREKDENGNIVIKGKKDENGNFPLRQYHERYYSKKPFIIEDALQQLTIPVKDVQTRPDQVLSSLKRGNMTAVTIFHNEQEEKGFLSVNAKAGRIDVRDQYHAVIESQNQSQSVSQSVSRQVTEEPAEEVKKNFSPKQEVNWTQSQPKGLSR